MYFAWRLTNRDKVRLYWVSYRKKRAAKDPLYKLKINLRSRISAILKQKKYNKNNTTQEITGCSFHHFKEHLETKFKDWMTWENYGKYNGTYNYGWDIDHIIPLSAAKTKEELLILFHYNNVQPLYSKLNRDIKKNFI